MNIKEIEVKTVLTKSNLPVSDYAVNPYVGCLHACKYCYASFMRRFTNHPEPWGTFLDVKTWPEVKDPSKYKGKELFLSSVTDPYQPHEAKYKRTRAIGFTKTTLNWMNCITGYIPGKTAATGLNLTGSSGTIQPGKGCYTSGTMIPNAAALGSSLWWPITSITRR